MPESDQELLLRLEEVAPLLEATRTRYRALVPALHAWGWRDRLRDLRDVAREVSRSDELVEAGLRRALRRAQAEAWPEGGEARTLLEDVSVLRTRLSDVLARRLDAAVEKPGAAMLEVLRLVVGVPRKVSLAERDAAAQEALQTDDSLIPSLQHFGTAVETLFSRPLTRGQRLPFTLAEYDALLASWPAGAQALAQGWVEIARIDTTGGVERELLRRSKRAPRGSRGPLGPRALVHATFWSTAAQVHQQTLLEERFAPVQLAEFERTPALRFLLAREVDGAARLEKQDARSALLMLAHELTASPEGRVPLVGGRAQVSAWAAAADALRDQNDWRRVRDGLRALAGRSVGLSLPPLYRVGQRTERAPLPELLTDFFSPSE